MDTFLGPLSQAALADAPIEPALDIVVRRLDAYGLIFLVIVEILLFHDDHLGRAVSLEDLRKSSQWIPVRLIAVDLAQSLVGVLALPS